MVSRCHICAVRVEEGQIVCGGCSQFVRAADVLAGRLLRYTPDQAMCVAEGLLRCVSAMPLPMLKHVVLVRERLEEGVTDGQGYVDGG